MSQIGTAAKLSFSKQNICYKKLNVSLKLIDLYVHDCIMNYGSYQILTSFVIEFQTSIRHSSKNAATSTPVPTLYQQPCGVNGLSLGAEGSTRVGPAVLSGDGQQRQTPIRHLSANIQTFNYVNPMLNEDLRRYINCGLPTENILFIH